MKTEGTELNQARSKPNTIDRPVRTAHIFVHYSSTRYYNTQFFSIFLFLQTNITSRMWPSGEVCCAINS